MITIIHGDDIAASRNQYHLIRQKTESPIILDGSNLDITTLTQALSSDGLFEEDKSVFIEQLLTKRKKSKELEELLSIINHYESKQIVLWEGKELDKKTSSLFPGSSIQPFKLPQVLFTFLDSLRPDNGNRQVQLFHDVLKSSDAEMVFAMMVRQFRLLLAVSSNTENPIEEIKRIAPWQQQKLSRQAKLFSEKQLLSAYSTLFVMDREQKTGKSSIPLSSTIDIFLMKL